MVGVFAALWAVGLGRGWQGKVGVRKEERGERKEVCGVGRLCCYLQEVQEMGRGCAGEVLPSSLWESEYSFVLGISLYEYGAVREGWLCGGRDWSRTGGMKIEIAPVEESAPIKSGPVT